LDSVSGVSHGKFSFQFILLYQLDIGSPLPIGLKQLTGIKDLGLSVQSLAAPAIFLSQMAKKLTSHPKSGQ